jgi:O-antigen ligase
MISVGQTEWQFSLRNATNTAFCAAFFFLPLSKPLLFLSLALAFGCFVVDGGLRGAKMQWRALPWAVPALLLSVYPILSPLIHPNPELRLSDLNLAYYWIIAFLTFLAASRMSIVPWIKSFLCGVFIVFCYAQAARLGWADETTGPASLRNYIMYSQMLALSVALLAILYAHEAGRRRKLLYLAGMAVFIFGLAFGKGRSGLLAVLLLFPYIFSNIFRQASRGRILLICGIAVVAVLMSPQVQTRIDAAVNDIRLMQNSVHETSLGYRVDMWKAATEVIRENPLLGAGASGFREHWHGTPRTGEALGFVEPHNAFLFYASSYGLPALLVLLWLYAAMLWTGWRHRDSLAGGIVFTFALVVVIGSFTNTMFFGAISRAWMMLFIGLQGAVLHAMSGVVPATNEYKAVA